MSDWRDAVATLQSLWACRPERERQMIRLAGIVLLPLMFYVAIWAPLSSRVEYLTKTVPSQRAALVRMRAQAQLVQRLQAKTGQAPNGTALLGFLETRAQAAGVSLNELSPTGARRARLVLGTVPFSNLLRFITHLQSRGITVVQARLIPAGPGRVSGRMTVRTRS